MSGWRRRNPAAPHHRGQRGGQDGGAQDRRAPGPHGPRGAFRPRRRGEPGRVVPRRCWPTSATSRTSTGTFPPSRRIWRGCGRCSRRAGDGSLVLLDELGTGTDPPRARRFPWPCSTSSDRGAHVVATTHLDGLKAYAYGARGAENAAVAFDPREGDAALSDFLRPGGNLQRPGRRGTDGGAPAGARPGPLDRGRGRRRRRRSPDPAGPGSRTRRGRRAEEGRPAEKAAEAGRRLSDARRSSSREARESAAARVPRRGAEATGALAAGRGKSFRSLLRALAEGKNRGARPRRRSRRPPRRPGASVPQRPNRRPVAPPAELGGGAKVWVRRWGRKASSTPSPRRARCACGWDALRHHRGPWPIWDASRGAGPRRPPVKPVRAG